MKLTFGDGLIQVQQGTTAENLRCLALTKLSKKYPVGSKPTTWAKEVDETQIDVVIAFKSVKSARVLQDELNELISVWSRDAAPIA